MGGRRTGILLIPFSSVVVWSCTAARAHAASPRTDSDVENHIITLPKPSRTPQKHKLELNSSSIKQRNAVKNRRKEKARRLRLGGCVEYLVGWLLRSSVATWPFWQLLKSGAWLPRTRLKNPVAAAQERSCLRRYNIIDFKKKLK